MLDSNDKTASITNVAQSVRAIGCLYKIRPSDADDVETKIAAELLNTPERSLAYIRAGAQVSGEVFNIPLPSQFKSGCNFDPDVVGD